jgi:Na+-transporting methylmalonyl-CoA/oxaloacetate decarboxylase gamma subunit
MTLLPTVESGEEDPRSDRADLGGALAKSMEPGKIGCMKTRHTDDSGSSHIRGLPVVLVATLVVVVIAGRESLSGLAAVASTASGVAVVLVLLLIVAIVVRLIARRSTSAWPWRSLTALAAVSSLLVVAVVLVTYRDHTASSRFADRVAKFPLPAGYQHVADDRGDAQHLSEPERAARAWRVPSGADPCADIKRAFAAWTDQSGQAFTRGTGCAVSAIKGTDKSEVSVSQDGSTVLLEMWLEGSSLFEF